MVLELVQNKQISETVVLFLVFKICIKLCGFFDSLLAIFGTAANNVTFQDHFSTERQNCKQFHPE